MIFIQTLLALNSRFKKTLLPYQIGFQPQIFLNFKYHFTEGSLAENPREYREGKREWNG